MGEREEGGHCWPSCSGERSDSEKGEAPFCVPNSVSPLCTGGLPLPSVWAISPISAFPGWEWAVPKWEWVKWLLISKLFFFFFLDTRCCSQPRWPWGLSCSGLREPYFPSNLKQRWRTYERLFLLWGRESDSKNNRCCFFPCSVNLLRFFGLGAVG